MNAETKIYLNTIALQSVFRLQLVRLLLCSLARVL